MIYQIKLPSKVRAQPRVECASISTLQPQSLVDVVGGVQDSLYLWLQLHDNAWLIGQTLDREVVFAEPHEMWQD